MAKINDKRNWISVIHQVAADNVRRMATKGEEFVGVTKRTRIDFATAIDTKKKPEGSKYVHEHITLHGDVNQKDRTSIRAVGLLFITKRCENNIKDYKRINGRITVTKVKGDRRSVKIVDQICN